MELIGGETAHTYLQSIYCKVKQWIQRNVSYNQIKMCICAEYIDVEWVKTWWKPNSTFAPWEHISLWNLEIWGELGLHFFSFFFIWTLVLFLSFFLPFFYSPSLFLQWNFLRYSNKNNGAFITGTKGMDEKYFWCSFPV
jgi:hypothetical protein